MQLYLNLLKTILNEGIDKTDRTGVGVKSIFSHEMQFDLTAGLPLLTTKKCHFKSIVGELLWMLSGSTNVKDLHQHNITIWDEWADKNGDLGPVYGKQWRSWQQNESTNIDQFSQLITNLINNPNSRRHIISAWNVADIDKMALPPCHAFIQFYVANNQLSCKLTQRSADVFLGVPFNIASYSLLTYMIAQQTNLHPGKFIWSGGDCHLYHNHIQQAELQLTRTPTQLPTVDITQATNLFSYKISDFKLNNYISQPHIPAEVAV